MASIMVDVQDTRVLLLWPKGGSREPPSIGSRSPWAIESPTKRRMVSAPQFASSPPAMLPPRPQSPVSPTPAVGALGSTFTSTFRADQTEESSVKVYEDGASEDDAPRGHAPEPAAIKSPSRSTSMPTSDLGKKSRSTNASEPEDFSEHDEENDPIVHSFGPFGENLLGRFQSFQPRSPERKRRPLKRSFNSPTRSASASHVNPSPIKNHVINQLAYSRVHALPLSTIHSNLPAELRGAMAKPSDTEASEMLSSADLKTILDGISCVGEISREGKDAAGKLLESEFYYVPEMDGDSMRRETVTQSLGKTSIRAARKQHKHNGISEFQVCGSYDFVCKGAVALVKGNAWTEYVQGRVVPAQYYRTVNESTGGASEGYLEGSGFLADVNNERVVKRGEYVERIAGLERFVMWVFEEDKTVIPKESGWFAEVNGTDGVVTGLRERAMYKEDWLGLRRLDEKGGLVFKSTPGGHMDLNEGILAEAFGEYFGPETSEKSARPMPQIGLDDDAPVFRDQSRLVDESKICL
ncbi:target of SBF [Friedmanniomyces endolithicus]|uniref:Target of SBF n=1 Tax=Rachicladosporium monterosium TaxID=1507873 RepID=A0ABR0L6J3_9PEZI|nr:target of SBF [Friedmanniomyces endolithicus]KAK5144279.1 target of SBF [Rachicladosporium monterosium]